MREKVGLRQRILASLGKRLMFWRSKKIPKLLMTLSYREAIRLLIEIHGSLEAALDAMFQLAVDTGPDFLNEWVERGSVIFSTYVADHALWIKAGYYSFVGDHIKDINIIHLRRKERRIESFGVSRSVSCALGWITMIQFK